MAVASVLISEVEPDVRRLLVLLVERLFPELPVVCLDPVPESAGFLLDSGPTYVLPKPFAPEQLDAVLELAL